MKPKTFENVFAPEVANERLTVDQIMVGMSVGAIQPDSLPPDVLEALADEVRRRERDQMTPSMFLTLVLGTMGEIKYRLRLQKYVFLADNQFSQARRGRKTAEFVYKWKPHLYGPYSEHLDLCVNDLLRAKIIEAFDVHESNKEPGVGYRLTVRGNAKFRRMLKNLEGESKAIYELLGKFQKDHTENQLKDFVYQMYPEYTGKSLIRDEFPYTKSG